jgi:hypothetical protein
MNRRIIMSHTLVTEIKKMVTHSKVGTLITFHRDMSSIITNCAGSGKMTKEPLQYVDLNPVPVWQLGRVVICRGQFLQV